MRLPFPLTASDLLAPHTAPKKFYLDRSHYNTESDQIAALANSRTVYCGNLSFNPPVTEDVLMSALPGSVGVIMGVNRQTRAPCGFAFVEFGSKEMARDAVRFHSGRVFEELGIKIELDPGHKPGREFGRGNNGGQLRDEIKERSGGSISRKRRIIASGNDRR